MTQPFHSTALSLYMEVLPRLAAAGRTIRGASRNLSSQLNRAAQSVAANLAEAATPCAGNSRSRLETAYGSLREVRTHLRVACIYGYLEADEAAAIDAVLDRVGAMTWRRIQKRQRR